MNPLVSIILPIFNVDKYLEQCLNSIINQTYKNIEIICVNDGSTDSCLEILYKYKKNDERIKIINQENQGVSAARNNGFNNCNGDYLLFIDPDDWIALDLVELSLNKAHNTKADIVLYDVNNVYINSVIKVRRVHDFIKKYNVDVINYDKNKNVVYQNGSPWAKLYKKEFLKKHNLKYDENIFFSEDSVYWIYLLRQNPKIALLDKCLYYYRKERVNSSSSHSIDLINKLWFVYKNYLLDNEKNVDIEDRIFALDYHTRLAVYIYSTCSNKDMLSYYEKSLNQFNNEYKKYKNWNLFLYPGYRLLKFCHIYTFFKSRILYILKILNTVKKNNNKMGN